LTSILEDSRNRIPRFPAWPRLPEHRLFVLLDSLVDHLGSGKAQEFFRGPLAERFEDLCALLDLFSEVELSRFLRLTASAARFGVDDHDYAEMEAKLSDFEEGLRRVGRIVVSMPEASWDLGDCLVSQRYRFEPHGGAAIECVAAVGHALLLPDGDGALWWGYPVAVHTLPLRTIVGERSKIAAVSVAVSTLNGEILGMLRDGAKVEFLQPDGRTWMPITRAEIRSWL
jgi:hypothetical protein